VDFDLNVLRDEFMETVYRNTGSVKEQRRFLQNIPIIVLTYGDRFYLGVQDRSISGGGLSKNIDDYDITYDWIPPIYYTVIDDSNRLIYMNLRDETSYYYRT